MSLRPQAIPNPFFTKVLFFAVLAVVAVTSTAQAIPINRCARLVRDPVGRETVVNTCGACIAVTIERRRPGQGGRPPNLRDYTIPAATNQPLSFRGPGSSRIIREAPCPG